MSEPIELETPRLWLRTWRDEDLDPLAKMSADPEVMRYFPSPITREESAAIIRRCRAHFAEHGFGLWALERKDNGRFIGFTGLGWTGFDAHFTPAIEIGWRLAPDQWGEGFAHEAAEASLACAFGRLGIDEVIAYTAVINEPSRRVMEAVGMTHDPRDDFEHPDLPEGHRLRPHVLYRARRGAWTP